MFYHQSFDSRAGQQEVCKSRVFRTNHFIVGVLPAAVVAGYEKFAKIQMNDKQANLGEVELRDLFATKLHAPCRRGFLSK
jgi:hypothetical protein